jgi:hypothetical protein
VLVAENTAGMEASSSGAWIRKQPLTGLALFPLKAPWPDHEVKDVSAAAAHPLLPQPAGNPFRLQQL